MAGADGEDAGARPGGRAAPKQSRSVETRNALLDAAARLFAEQGYEATTTHQIAAGAGVSVGALYRYFADKEAVLVETYGREMTALRDRMLRAFDIGEIAARAAASRPDGTAPGAAPDPLATLVREGMELAFQVFAERPALRRVLVEQSRHVPALVALRRQQEREVHEAVRTLLVLAPGVRLPDVEVGAYLVVLFMESLIDDWTLHRRDLPLDEPRVVAGAVDFVLSWVLGRGRSG